MALRATWVERIFERLTLAYGEEFVHRWEGQDIAAVKANWADELAGFALSPHAIAFALANLPDGTPPTVLQFRQLARRAPPPTPPQGPAPTAGPARNAAAADLHQPEHMNPKTWAWKLKAREAHDPRSLTATQRQFWRDVLKHELSHQRVAHEDAIDLIEGGAP